MKAVTRPRPLHRVCLPDPAEPTVRAGGGERGSPGRALRLSAWSHLGRSARPRQIWPRLRLLLLPVFSYS